MSAEGQHIIFHPPDFFHQFSAALCCIYVKKDVSFCQFLPDCFNRLDDSCFVIYMHQAYKQCVLSDKGKNPLRINPSGTVRVHNINIKSFPSHCLYSLQNGLMFYGRCNHMLFSCSFCILFKSMYGNIVAFRGSARKKHFTGSHSQQIGDLTSGIFNNLSRLFSVIMRPAVRVSNGPFIYLNHAIKDPGIDRRGCIIV